MATSIPELLAIFQTPPTPAAKISSLCFRSTLATWPWGGCLVASSTTAATQRWAVRGNRECTTH